MIIEAKNVSYNYGEKMLLSDVSLSIEETDKIGLIGVNGCGKSTFLSIMALDHDIEKGSIQVIGKKKISYMPQEVVFTKDETILEYLNRLSMPLYETKSILTKLEINDFDVKISSLSGGNKRKLALGIALVQESDLLILDEPTNHLDSDIIEWLEKFLIKTTKAILLVTHDRYFLERVCNKIVELDHGKIYSYEANYSQYLELKSERMEMAKASERKLNSFLRKEYDWIKRGALARTTKDKRRIENYEALTNREKEVNRELVLQSTTSRLGRKTIEFSDVSFSYNDKLIFKNLSFNLNKDERIGIIGKNGTGKTTLLDVISGRKNPSKGSIEVGSTIKIGYFRQENIELDYNKRAIDYINDIAEYVKTKKGTLSATAMLENFLFDDPYVYIGKLSGGEKRRLYLLGVLMASPNVLLLDEPTNDLDITTLAILEDYLDDFEGIVIVASHDRYFLDKVCDKIMALDDNVFTFYNGNYSFYKEKFIPKNKVVIENNYVKQENKKVKLSFKEQKEFEVILDEIDEIENKIKEADDFINQNYSNYEACVPYYNLKEELNKVYEEKVNRWEYLNNIYEESLKK